MNKHIYEYKNYIRLFKEKITILIKIKINLLNIYIYIYILLKVNF